MLDQYLFWTKNTWTLVKMVQKQSFHSQKLFNIQDEDVQISKYGLIVTYLWFCVSESTFEIINVKMIEEIIPEFPGPVRRPPARRSLWLGEVDRTPAKSKSSLGQARAGLNFTLNNLIP